MQNHVKLEVSLEVINNEIATNMKKLNIAQKTRKDAVWGQENDNLAAR